MVSNATYCCAGCRFVSKGMATCPQCSHPMMYMGRRWRAPKKTNDKAWARINAGDFLWEIDPKDKVKWSTLYWERMKRTNPKYGESLL